MELNGENFIGADEVANMLGIHKTTLHGWLRKDQTNKKNKIEAKDNFKCPPYGRIGSRYIFRKSDVEKFIKDSINR